MSYTLISEQVLGTASTVTFSSIPQTYTDLVLEFIGYGAGTNANESITCQISGDTGTNYSYLYLRGDGASAGSATGANMIICYIGQIAANTTTSYSSIYTHFLSYTAGIYKTVLSHDSSPGVDVNIWANEWRSTAAITSIYVFDSNSSGLVLAAGTTLRLWGVK